ncbi:hypothetical protein [Paenibacillus radicis (ex Xue et al. 2023)]|uniref:Uncharacterized protein n=1 Tax=Paenibacillus radicis (ex Xue et al. 2023) TaxID=2972489 RepID=A0ABT1YP87_9BACL|nr:hypothetical protein [Paenibacillus radicis (ex Xue et al. 2023)]MCR8634990.1 hypothetical protein [Paenibacillus radicis (ex Xue et al. 2023)]
MTIALKPALLMDMPDGKLPGFYAQIVKALAAKAPLFDRDKELLIFDSLGEREMAYPIMQQYKIPYENMDLLLLPATVSARPDFTDYGFVSRSGLSYVYAESVYLFTLHHVEPAAEPIQALQQFEEHLLASIPQEEVIYIVDLQFEELMKRIAQAYNCELRPFPKPL